MEVAVCFFPLSVQQEDKKSLGETYVNDLFILNQFG